MIIPPEINMSKSLHPEDLSILDKYESSEKTLFQVDSEFNSISVVENTLGRFLKFDDSYQSGILNYNSCPNNLPYINYFLISCLLNPDIESILVLGMGSGHFISSFTKLLPCLKKIDIVEIDPHVTEIAQEYFDFKHNDRVNVNIQDARVFVRNSKNKYDLIVMDLASHEGLFYRFMTEEFLREIQANLNSGGMLASNLFGSPDFRQDNNLIFNSILKTYRAVFNDILIFPTIYGNYEFYKQSLGLKHELPDLTNMILFATDSGFNITKDELVLRALNLKETCNLTEIKQIDKYIEDMYEFDINLDNFSVMKDEWESDPQFNLDNLKKYLYIDHMVNNQSGKINPVDDERKSVKSG